MSSDFESLLAQVAAGRDLSRDEATAALDAMMAGRVAEELIATFLLALRDKGECVAEIAGAAAAMRRHMTPIRSRYERLLDTCGTGGGGSQTFNISTAAALVIAAAGVPVAKHGNRSVTSRSGSADVLAALGVNIEADLAQVERCLDELGICFCFAPLMHPAMRHVAAVRKRLGVRTIFNILGPLANPARATHQLLGAGRPELREPLAAALVELGIERALVVSGADGLGEVTLAADTSVTEVAQGALSQRVFAPEQFGLTRQSLEAITVADAAESAAIVRGVLTGEPGPARDIVVVNAAAGLLAFSACTDPLEAAARAVAAIDSGAASQLLERLIAASHAA
ncbi:MAG: anthranilate phosphoribosyltransferase [Pirellulales bacterium]|nr:anthranilate phosphoribosyltransferase [Pirellulales bacterium]